MTFIWDWQRGFVAQPRTINPRFPPTKMPLQSGCPAPALTLWLQKRREEIHRVEVLDKLCFLLF